MVEITRKMISISEDNYLALKRLGTAGDSFNDVLNEILQTHKKR
jgi:predicted CopG family antitoxin